MKFKYIAPFAMNLIVFFGNPAIAASLNIKKFEFFVKAENVQLSQVQAIVTNNNSRKFVMKSAQFFKQSSTSDGAVSIYKIESPEFKDNVEFDRYFGDRFSVKYRFLSSQGEVSYSLDPNILLDAGDYLVGGARMGKSDPLNYINVNSNPGFLEPKEPVYHLAYPNHLAGIQSGIQLGDCYDHVYTNEDLFSSFIFSEKNRFGSTCPVQKEFYSQAQALLGQIVIRSIPGIDTDLFIKPIENYDNRYTRLAKKTLGLYNLYWSDVGEMDLSNLSVKSKIEYGKIYFTMNKFSKLLVKEDPNEIVPFQIFAAAEKNRDKLLRTTFSSDDLREPNCADELAKEAFLVIESLATEKKVLPTGSDVQIYDNMLKIHVAFMHARKALTAEQRDVLLKLRQAYAPQMDSLINYILNTDYSTLGNAMLFNPQKLNILKTNVVETPF